MYVDLAIGHYFFNLLLYYFNTLADHHHHHPETNRRTFVGGSIQSAHDRIQNHQIR
jgi:hypothetical protein